MHWISASGASGVWIPRLDGLGTGQTAVGMAAVEKNGSLSWSIQANNTLLLTHSVQGGQLLLPIDEGPTMVALFPVVATLVTGASVLKVAYFFNLAE